MMFVEQY
jgi:hypothetical protein